MKTKSFRKLIKSIDKLNTQQKRELDTVIKERASRKFVSLSLESDYSSLICPNCGGNCIQRWGRRNDLQRYRCKSCTKTFNSLTGTPLARLRRKGHWLDYANCLKEGLSVRNAAKVCQISKNTSFRWRHRFLKNAKGIKAYRLEGIIEASDLFILKSEKGSKSLKRKPRRRGGSLKENLNKINDAVCLLIGRDRHTNTYDVLLQKLNSGLIEQGFKDRIGKDALFCSDGKCVYKKFAKDNHYRHGFINISKGEVVKKDIVHLNNVKKYQLDFRDWIMNHFKGVATKYLENYMGWFRELDEFNQMIDPNTILLRAKQGGLYKYQPLKVTQLMSALQSS